MLVWRQFLAEQAQMVLEGAREPIYKLSPAGTAELQTYPKLGLNDASFQQPLFHPATALSLQRPSPFCHPEANRGICSAPFVCPAPCGPTTSTHHHRIRMKHQPPLCLSAFPGDFRGTADPSTSPDFLSRVRLRSTACGSL
jgi:hypothetical protein